MTDTEPGRDDLLLLQGMTQAVEAAGAILLSRFSTSNRVDGPDALLAALEANDAASLAVLRPALERLRPGARWDEDEEGRGSLGPGEWWVVDPAEGNVNLVHGSPNWGVTATLVRDDRAVATVVRLPVAGETYAAVRGQGAFLNGSPLVVSAKTELRGALVGTGQARPGEGPEIKRLLAASVRAMLDAALLVSTVVPATLSLVPVAAGHTDAFWQYGQVRSGLVAGGLLVEEAGGVVVDTNGAPWTLVSDDFVATAPGISDAITEVLAGVR
jgi:myo-inositol-1(or 4)-monophosphatase